MGTSDFFPRSSRGQLKSIKERNVGSGDGGTGRWSSLVASRDEANTSAEVEPDFRRFVSC